MKRGHKIRLNPTPEQAAFFRRCAGTARFVHNWGLGEWNRQYQEGGKPNAIGLKKQFNRLKGEQYPWVYDVPKDVAENAFADLGAAFQNFFDSVTGKRPDRVGYPRFKAKKHSRLAFGLNNDKFKVNGQSLYVPKLGWVNMAEPLRFEGKQLSATLTQDGGHWYVAINVDLKSPTPVEFERKSVGVDLGVKDLAVLSSGERFENQKMLRSELNRLKRLNRELSRRQPGSGRWWDTKRKLQQFHARIKNKRMDYLHKMTTTIARKYQIIGLEDLNVKGMLRAEGPLWENRRLALSLSDAALGEIKRQLLYKSEQFGGVTQKVGRFFASSKLCNVCDWINHDLTLTDRTWTCQGCGTVHDRDWNASCNIEDEALRLVAVVALSRR